MTRARQQPTARLDATRAGSQSYTPADVELLEHALRSSSRRRPLSVADLANQTGIDGRAVRQINSDFGGVRWVVGECSDGWFMPTTYDEVAPKFSQWRHHLQSLQARLDREQAWAEANLPRHQSGLFDV